MKPIEICFTSTQVVNYMMFSKKITSSSPGNSRREKPVNLNTFALPKSSEDPEEVNVQKPVLADTSVNFMVSYVTLKHCVLHNILQQIN